jgi:hypothetical protein
MACVDVGRRERGAALRRSPVLGCVQRRPVPGEGRTAFESAALVTRSVLLARGWLMKKRRLATQPLTLAPEMSVISWF